MNRFNMRGVCVIVRNENTARSSIAVSHPHMMHKHRHNHTRHSSIVPQRLRVVPRLGPLHRPGVDPGGVLRDEVVEFDLCVRGVGCQGSVSHPFSCLLCGVCGVPGVSQSVSQASGGREKDLERGREQNESALFTRTLVHTCVPRRRTPCTPRLHTRVCAHIHTPDRTSLLSPSSPSEVEAR